MNLTSDHLKLTINHCLRFKNRFTELEEFDISGNSDTSKSDDSYEITRVLIILGLKFSLRILRIKNISLYTDTLSYLCFILTL
jgi:hypothetical protein